MSRPSPAIEIARGKDEPLAFDGWIAALRPELLAYVSALVPQALHEAEDVVQATLTVLWEKRADFREGTDFRAWAFRTAYFQALALRRDLSRSKVAVFSDQMLQRVAEASEACPELPDPRAEALRLCVKALPQEDRKLVAMKYATDLPLADHARRLGVPASRLQKSLSRLRLALRHCVERRLRNR